MSSSSEEDEDWTTCDLDGDDEKVPGFEDYTVISTHDLPGDNEDTILEFFLAKSPEGTVSLIQVDPDNEESTMLNGADCNKVRRKLCSLKGIDPNEVDAETAHAVFVAEMGEVPKALVDFDKLKNKAPKQNAKKTISDSDDDGEKKLEPPEKSRKIESSASSAEKKKPAAAKPKKKVAAPAAKAPGSKVNKKPANDTAKKAAPQRQAKKPEKPKKEAAQVAQKEPPKQEDVVVATAPAASEEKPKRPPAKRKRDGVLDAFVIKSEPPPKKASPSAPFTWQLTINGSDMASLRTTLAAFPS